MVSESEGFLRPGEVAALFRVTVRTLINWERKGFLVPVRLPSGRKRYRRGDVEALLERISGAVATR